MIMLLCAIPLLIMAGFRLLHPEGKKLSLPEYGVGAVICIGLGFGMYYMGKYSALTFTEYWNGKLVSTEHRSIEYDRSYESCDSDGKNCVTITNTGRDMNWYVTADFGKDGKPFEKTWSVRYVDCSSTSRSACNRHYPADAVWASATAGDAVTMPNSYQNYIRASDGSLFGFGESSYQGKLPKYPSNMHDHWKLDRVILDGVSLPAGQSVDDWNKSLSDILTWLGPNRQANMILVLTNQPKSYANALISSWDGANKNDIVITAGFTNGLVGGVPDWVDVHAWAKEAIMPITMRDELLDNPEIWKSNQVLFPVIRQITQEHFVRRPMAEFEYLKDTIEPSKSALTFMVIMSIIAGIGLSLLFIAKDIFDTDRNLRSRKWK